MTIGNGVFKLTLMTKKTKHQSEQPNLRVNSKTLQNEGRKATLDNKAIFISK